MKKQVVRAFIFNNEGKILLAKHSINWLWVLPGWHVEVWENLHEALIRELKEEFNLNWRFFEIDSEEKLFHKWKELSHYPLPISIYSLEYKKNDWRDWSRIEYIFLMETDDTIKETQLEEIYKYEWFDPEDILMMKPNIDTYDFYIQMLEKLIDSEEE